MQKSLCRFIASVALGLSLAGMPATSFACDKCVVGAVTAAGQAIVSAVGVAQSGIVAAIVTAQNGLVNALRGATQTLATQEAKSAELVAQSNQRTESQMEIERQESRYVPPDACAVVASSRGVQDAARSAPSLGGGVGRGGGGGSRSPSGGVSGNMQKVLDIAANRVEAPSPEQQASMAAAGACETFVSSGGNPVRARTCSAAGFSVGIGNGHPDADIRAETLLDGPQRGATASQYRRRLTVDADGEERQAVEAYLRNLSTPVDLRHLTKAELTRPAGRQYMAVRDAYEARMSLAEKPSRALALNRTANATLLPVVRQMLTSDVAGQFTKAYLDTNYPRWTTRGISLDELINLEAERRYMNKNWHLKMASMPPEAHIKEQTTMMAYQVWLTAKLYEKMDHLSVVEGQSAATAIRQEMIPQLIAHHGAASR